MQDSVLPRGVGLRKPHISRFSSHSSLLTPPVSTSKSIRRMRSVQDSVLPRGVGLRKPHISLLAIPHLLTSLLTTPPVSTSKSIRRMRSVKDSVLPRGVGLRKPHSFLPSPLFSLLTSRHSHSPAAQAPFSYRRRRVHSPQAGSQKEKPALSHRLFGIG